MCLAIPGQVLEMVDETNQIAKVDVVGVRRNINVSLLAADGASPRAADGADGASRRAAEGAGPGADGGVAPGDWVLIHVGFAISKIDEQEAEATKALLEAMGQEYEQELEELKASVIE